MSVEISGHSLAHTSLWQQHPSCGSKNDHPVHGVSLVMSLGLQCAPRSWVVKVIKFVWQSESKSTCTPRISVPSGSCSLSNITLYSDLAALLFQLDLFIFSASRNLL